MGNGDTDTYTENKYIVTSLRLKESTRREAKVYAAEHDMTLQEVVDAALRNFLNIE